MSGCHVATVTRYDSRLTLALAPAVATVRQGSLLAPAPAAAIVQQQGSPFGTCPCHAYRGRAADYFTVLTDSWFSSTTLDRFPDNVVVLMYVTLVRRSRKHSCFTRDKSFSSSSFC